MSKKKKGFIKKWAGKLHLWLGLGIGAITVSYTHLHIRLMSVTLYENIHVDNLKSYYIAP